MAITLIGKCDSLPFDRKSIDSTRKSCFERNKTDPYKEDYYQHAPGEKWVSIVKNNFYNLRGLKEV